MPTWTYACRLDAVPDGRGLGVDVGGLRVAIFGDRGSITAHLSRCPHASGPIEGGWVEDGEAVCPVHRWRFRLASGRCSTVAGHSIHRFDLEVRGDQVWVAV